MFCSSPLISSHTHRLKRFITSRLVAVFTAICFVFTTTITHAQVSSVVMPSVWHGRSLDNPLYDISIRKWNKIYNPEIPWYWAKAQLVAESGLKPNAVSPVGAKGLGQFMPDTWKDMQRELRFNGSEYTPVLSIQAHAYYMQKLRGQFKAERPEWDKHSLALASYNAGLGNILKAQKAGGGSLMYDPMIKALPTITGKAHSRETTMYVQRIWKFNDYYKSIYEGE